MWTIPSTCFICHSSSSSSFRHLPLVYLRRQKMTSLLSFCSRYQSERKKMYHSQTVRKLSTSSTNNSNSSRPSPIISETYTSNNRIVDYYMSSETSILQARNRTEIPTPSSQPSSSTFTRLRQALIRTFLPVDYPHSIAPWYIRYVGWQFVQSLSGSAQWVLTTNAMLVGVGLTADPTTLTAWSITLNWVLKDGIGALGMIFFVRLLGTWLDTDTKRMMWRADVIHNLGSALELLIPLFSHIFGFFLFTASVANLIKGVAALSTGACRAAILKAAIRRENFAEVTAKTHTQNVLAYVLGMILGIGVSTFLAFTSASSLFKLRAVSFTTLNLQRASLVLETYFREGRVLAPHEVRDERIIRPPRYRHYPRLFFCSSVSRTFRDATELSIARQRCNDERFLIHTTPNEIFVLLHRDATPVDELRALFVACHLQYIRRSQRTHHSTTPLNSSQKMGMEKQEPESLASTSTDDEVTKSLNIMKQDFASFLASLQMRGWNTSETVLHCAGPRFF